MIESMFCGHTLFVGWVPDKDKDEVAYMGQTKAMYAEGILEILLNPNLKGNGLVDVLMHELVETWLRVNGLCYEATSGNKFEPKFIFNHSDLTCMSRDCTQAMIDIMTKMKLTVNGNKVKKKAN